MPGLSTRPPIQQTESVPLAIHHVKTTASLARANKSISQYCKFLPVRIKGMAASALIDSGNVWRMPFPNNSSTNSVSHKLKSLPCLASVLVPLKHPLNSMSLENFPNPYISNSMAWIRNSNSNLLSLRTWPWTSTSVAPFYDNIPLTKFTVKMHSKSKDNWLSYTQFHIQLSSSPKQPTLVLT